MGEHGDNYPSVELERFRVKITEGYSFVEIGAVDSLEGERGVWGAVVVGECIWDGTAWKEVGSCLWGVLYWRTLTYDLSHECKDEVLYKCQENSLA